MIQRFSFAFLLACVAAGIGCGGDNPFAPGGNQHDVRRLTKLEVNPGRLELDPGSTVQLSVVALDQFGGTMSYAEVNYNSGTPGIAAVSNTGFVTAMSPGAATISASVSLDGVTKSGYTLARILQTVVLTFGEKGWDRDITYLRVGDKVVWRSGPLSWSGVPVRYVLVMDDWMETLLNALDMSDGVASLQFTKSGTYYFCSGACADPADFGTVVVND